MFVFFLNVQMNKFLAGHVKVSAWELFILHIARGYKATQYLKAENVS